MFKKIAFAGFGIALLASPLLASADTASDLQAQIQALLAQVRQLQAQLTATVDHSDTNPAQPTTPMRPSGIACLPILHPIALGAQGADVSNLQQYLGVNPTGYYGPITEAAVQKLQAANGIVSSGDAATTGYGAVGPRTRDWLGLHCGGGGNNNPNFSASPTSGDAPLAVTFRTTTNPSTSADTFTVDFGDGTNGIMQFNGLGGTCDAGSGGPCNGYSGLVVSHTYAANGTYTATLSLVPACRNSEPACMIATRSLGTVTITVGSRQICAMAYLVCPAGTHHVDGPGSCQQTCQPDPTSTGAPTVSGVDGPASLNVGQQGTWTVHASVANNANTNLHYSVIWGDEGVFDQIQNFASIAAPTILQTSGSFTHSYANAGTYRPTFTVANDAGSAQASASVQVGGTLVCNMMYRICPAGTHNGGQCNQDCISDTTSSMFSASPTSGNAPLNVSFGYPYTTDNSNWMMNVNFGDGTSGQMNALLSMIACQQGTDCARAGAWNANHTYSAAGTYTATLTRGGLPLCATCSAPVLGTATISVGAMQQGSLTATPTSGNAPLTVTFGGVGNGISFGDGSGMAASCTGRAAMSDYEDPARAPGCSAIGLTTHTYPTAGTYIASSGNNSVKIIVSGTNCGEAGCPVYVPPSLYPNTQTSSDVIHASAGDTSANVANALTALESALKALLGQLGQ